MGYLQLHFHMFRSDSHHLPLSVQRLSAREFSRRSIKDRAVLLSSLFPGSSRPPPAPLSPLPKSQVVYRNNRNACLMSQLTLLHGCDNGMHLQLVKQGCIIVLDIQSVTCSCLVRAGSSWPTDLQVQCLICVSDPEC